MTYMSRVWHQCIILLSTCNTTQNGYAGVTVAIETIAVRRFSRGAFALKAWFAPKSPCFSRENLRWDQQFAERTPGLNAPLFGSGMQ